MTTAVETDYPAFYAAHYEGAVRYVTARLGQDAAEDVVAEAFTAVWKRWGELDDPAGYLYGACKNGVKTEYADRNRRPVAVADVPDRPATAAPASLAGEVISARLLLKSLALDTEPKHTAYVAAGLADGHDRRRVAEMTGLPLAEVHRSVRQLRKHWLTREAQRRRAAPAGYIPQRLTGQAVRELPRRQRQVMALAALGVRPVAIAALLDIEPDTARVNLYHARQAITAKIEVDSRGAVDAAVGSVLGTRELLDLLPPYPWRNDGLEVHGRDAALESWLRQVSPDDRGGGSRRLFIDSRARLATFLTQISVVIAVARKALCDRSGIAAQCGSVRWHPPGTPWRISGAIMDVSMIHNMPRWLAERQLRAVASRPREEWQMSFPPASRYRTPVPAWPSADLRRRQWTSPHPAVPADIIVEMNPHTWRSRLSQATCIDNL